MALALAPDWLLDQLPVAGSVADGSLEDLGVDVGQVVVADDGEAGVWRRRPQAATLPGWIRDKQFTTLFATPVLAGAGGFAANPGQLRLWRALGGSRSHLMQGKVRPGGAHAKGIARGGAGR